LRRRNQIRRTFVHPGFSRTPYRVEIETRLGLAMGLPDSGIKYTWIWKNRNFRPLFGISRNWYETQPSLHKH